MALLLVVAGCLTDSDSGDDTEKSDKYTLTLKPGGTEKLLTDEEMPLTVTPDKAISEDEFYMVTIAGGDSVIRRAFTTDISDEPFSFDKEGEYTLTVEVMKKTEFNLLELLAPDYGSAQMAISVRDPEISIKHELYGDYVIFTVESPVEDWFPSGNEYYWNFGDESAEVTTDTTVTGHSYDETGDYTISVSVYSYMRFRDKDDERSRVVTDSTTVSVNTLFDKKKITISSLPADGKFMAGMDADFEITLEPPAEAGDYLFWAFTSPDSTYSFITSAVRSPYAEGERFIAGDWSLEVSLLDSLEMVALGPLAPYHGSGSYAFSVRDITIDIQAAQTGDGVFSFTAYSPEQDWLPGGVQYNWDFGDNGTYSEIDNTTVEHEYEVEGEYDVIVIVKALLHDDDDFRSEVARDTLSVEVEEYVPELEIAISPQDTTVHNVMQIRMEVECTPRDYNRKVTWKIDYGDGETEEYTYGVSEKTLYHLWSQPGQHILDVALHDPETDALLAQDSAVIMVDNTTFLEPITYAYAYVKAYTVYHYGASATWPSNWGFGTGLWTAEWNGFSFTATQTSVTGTQTTTNTITGTLTEDLSEAIEIVYTNEFEDTDYQDTGGKWTRFRTFTLEHVPIQHISGSYYNSMRTNLKGSEIGQYVSDFEAWERRTDADGVELSYEYYEPFDFANEEFGEAELNLEFKAPDN